MIAQTHKIQRVVTFLNRNEIDFLDKFGKDALFSTGSKLSRAKLIAWMVDILDQLKVSGKGIRSEKDFEQKVIELLKKQNPPATEGSPLP